MYPKHRDDHSSDPHWVFSSRAAVHSTFVIIILLINIIQSPLLKSPNTYQGVFYILNIVLGTGETGGNYPAK
jgi:hypothetical protein